MTIFVRVHLWQQVYTGTVEAGRRAVPEWPPSPYRLISALLAGAHHCDPPVRSVAREALEEVSRSPAPRIITAAWPKEMVLPSNWVPATGDDKADNRPFQASAMTTGGRRRPVRVHAARMNLDAPDIYFEIDVDLTTPQRQALAEAAEHVPYFGRATHPAELSIVDRVEWPADVPLDTHAPVDGLPGDVRSWTPAALPELDRAFEAWRTGLPTPPGSAKGVRVGYAVDDRHGILPRNVVDVLPFRGPLTRPADITAMMLTISETIRAAGEEASGSWAFPMLQVGHEHSSGACAAVAIVSAERGAGHTAALETASAEIGERLSTQFRASAARNPRRWTEPALRWVSASPAALHPKTSVAHLLATHELEKETGQAARVTLTRTPTYGQRRWPDDEVTGLGQWFVTVEFDEPVPGPLRFGGRSDEGFGLLLPVTSGHAVTPSGTSTATNSARTVLEEVTL